MYCTLNRPSLRCREQCYCGTAGEFEDNPVASDRCGASTMSLCTGDPTTACGGFNAISVYQRREFSFVGCFQDDKDFRLMGPKGSAEFMSAKVSWYGFSKVQRQKLYRFAIFGEAKLRLTISARE